MQYEEGLCYAAFDLHMGEVAHFSFRLLEFFGEEEEQLVHEFVIDLEGSLEEVEVDEANVGRFDGGGGDGVE